MTSPTVFSRMVLALPFLAAACSDGGKGEPVDTFATRVEARAGIPFARKGPAVTLVVPASAAPGATVPIRIRVANETSAPLDLNLRGQEVTFDIVVTDSAGNAIWRRLEGAAIPATLQRKALGPGEVMEIGHDWDQKSQSGGPVSPGRYTVRGLVLTDGQSTLESTATLEITAP